MADSDSWEFRLLVQWKFCLGNAAQLLPTVNSAKTRETTRRPRELKITLKHDAFIRATVRQHYVRCSATPTDQSQTI
jgi:hypothetical protein